MRRRSTGWIMRFTSLGAMFVSHMIYLNLFSTVVTVYPAFAETRVKFVRGPLFSWSIHVASMVLEHVRLPALYIAHYIKRCRPAGK